MALSTNAAPVYGGGTLVIEFPVDSPLVEDASYYAVYEGSQQRHVTTARFLSPTKLHSIIPGHHEAEEVKFSVLCYHGDNKSVLTTSNFHFHNESAYNLAQFLADSIYSPESLEDLELIKSDNFDLADEELSTLDQRLSRSLAHLHFPDWWSVLGPDFDKEDQKPRETLFHFAARLGLNRTAAFFIKKPGSAVALTLHNKNGDTPRDVALANQHDSLAQLLSEYNSHGLMPVGRWIETDRGLVHTRETGDVTLTSKLETHHRTVEEDIIVLNGIQHQLEEQDTNVALQWQTPWPTTQTQEADNSQSILSGDEAVKSICEKAQELQNLISLETISEFSDNHDSNSDPNIEAGHLQENVDYSDECDSAAMDTDQLPQLHVSEGEEDGDNEMEEGISNLHEYNDHLHRIREKSTVFNRILEQDLRSEKLARFSSSCPALDVEARDSPLPVIDEADHHKSMVDLAEESSQPADDAVVSESPPHREPHTPRPRESPDDVHVIVEGATTDSSKDYGLRTQEYDEFLKEFYGGNVAQTRRRSFSPKPTEDEDKENSNSATNMLIHGNKSVSFMPISDGEDSDDESFQRDTDTSASDSYLSGDRSGHSRDLYSSGDIPELTQDKPSKRKDGSQEDRSANKTTQSGRGQPNPARYSADIENMMRQERHSGSSLDKISSTLSRSATTEAGRRVLNVPNQKMFKALSTSSIPAAVKADKHHGSAFKGLSQDSKHATFQRQDEVEEEEPPSRVPAQIPPQARRRKKAEISLYDFLNEPSNFSNETSTSHLSKIKDKEKEEKNRKTSIFSRLQSSYRIKKNKDKEGKNKVSHRFVPLSSSNNITCDICNKPLSNKPALQCEVCLVNVHDSSCKEHVTLCDKGRPKSLAQKQLAAETEAGYNEKNASMGVSNLRPSYSFKDNSTSSRAQSVYVGGASQPLPHATQPPIQPEVQQLQTASAQLQRRSLPNPSRAIAEEGEAADPANQSRLDLGHSNITETNSHSIESLDEVDSVHDVGYDDVELGSLEVEEPETWSETIDKKVLKKMNTKDIKRQDTIWELIQTERQYCKRLKTLEIIFRNAMWKEKFPRKYTESMFPHLDDLVGTHMVFFRQLQELQNRHHEHGVQELGPTLYEQFSGESAARMKSAYGGFCSGHLEAVQFYKDLIAKDRKFIAFIKQRVNHPLCKKREIPDFILLITQRPTKYPILIEAVIKSTRDKKDREILLKVLALSRDVLKNVDDQVAAAERRMRKIDIYNRLESRSFAIHRGKKFRKSDIISSTRKLLHEGVVWWKNARGKNVEVLAVVLDDVLFFLQENNQKYSFFSQDNKYGVVSLYNLLVREKGSTRDNRGMYLISQNKSAPEMYEVVFKSGADMQKWAQVLRFAVDNCPPEEEETEEATEAEEERRRLEERNAKARAIMDLLREKDEEIRRCCDAKNKLLDTLVAVYNDTEETQQHSRPSSRDFDVDVPPESSGALQAAIQEVSLAATHLTTMLQDTGTSLSRSVSSVGEHSSHSFTAIAVPKRAETFGGFDNSHEVSRVKHQVGTDVADCYEGMEPSEADLSQYMEDGLPTNQKLYDSEAESGLGSSPSVSVMSPVSGGSQEQMNVASLLKTLHSIVHLTASQGTAVETLRAQLAEANERINKLSADVHEKKGPGYRHNQLEELRNLQGVILKEKEDWEKKRDKERQRLEAEWGQLEEMRKGLEKQEADIKQQKEELNKKREVLQRQMDLLRQSGQLPRDGDIPAENVQSKPDFVPGHRRSASAESFNNSGDEPKKPGSGSGSGSGASHKDSFRVDNKSSTKLQSFSFSSKANVPEHLLSATNEQKVGPKNVQKLPSKLLSSSGQHSGSQSDLRKGSPGPSNSAVHNVSAMHHGSNQSSPSLVQDKEHAPMGHSLSAGNLNNQGLSAAPTGSSVSHPKGNWQSNRPKPSPIAGLGMVMKLAEKGDKKGKSSQSKGEKGAQSLSPQQGDQADQTVQRPRSGTSGHAKEKFNHKPQKSDSDVIYF